MRVLPSQNGRRSAIGVLKPPDDLRDSRVMWERKVIRLARSSHGVVTRGQILAQGASPHMIRRRVDSGRWTQPQPGVYYLNVTPPTWKSDVLCAVLGSGPDAIASYRTAAVLHDMEGIYGRMIDVTVPYGDRPEPDGVVLHRTRRPMDVAILDAIPISEPARTILDLSSMVGDRLLERVIASAIRKKITSVAEIDTMVGRRGGRGVGGTRRTRRVLRVVAGDVSGSFAEVDMGQLIRDAALPPPVPQLRIRLPGGDNAYPDFAWPDRMRVAEVDGLEAHATAEQLAHDLHRQNQLLNLGWDLRRWPASVVRRHPQRVIEELTRFVNAPFQPRSVEAGRA